MNVGFGLIVVEFLFPVIIGADGNLVGFAKGGEGEVAYFGAFRSVISAIFQGSCRIL
jgi:hypothetical protein